MYGNGKKKKQQSFFFSDHTIIFISRQFSMVPHFFKDILQFFLLFFKYIFNDWKICQFIFQVFKGMWEPCLAPPPWSHYLISYRILFTSSHGFGFFPAFHPITSTRTSDVQSKLSRTFFPLLWTLLLIHVQSDQFFPLINSEFFFLWTFCGLNACKGQPELFSVSLPLYPWNINIQIGSWPLKSILHNMKEKKRIKVKKKIQWIMRVNSKKKNHTRYEKRGLNVIIAQRNWGLERLKDGGMD